MLEKDIETNVCQWAKKQGLLVYKFTSPVKRSVPDRLFIGPGPRFAFIEFKAPLRTPTPNQDREMDRLKRLNVPVAWFSDTDGAKKWLAKILLGC